MDDAILTQILHSPADSNVRSAYADTLRQRHDPRADYVEQELQWAATRQASDVSKLRDWGAAIDPIWAARISRPPVGVCCDRVRFLEDARQAKPRVSPADLRWLESRFQVALPADYRAFLLNYNGGVPDPNRLLLSDELRMAGCNDAIVLFCSIWAAKDAEIDWDMDLVWRFQQMDGDLRMAGQNIEDLPFSWQREMARRWRAEPHAHWVVIGSGAPTGGLEWFCLECRGPSTGRVYCVNPAMDSPDDLDYCLVSPTFAGFLAMLSDTPTQYGGVG